METKIKSHPLKTIRRWAAGLVLAAVVGCICFLGGRISASDQEEEADAPALDAVVLETRLTEINELAVVSYHYTNMSQFESSSDFYGVKLPFTTKKFILTYDGEIKAGVKLSEASLEVVGNEATVRLPAAVILSHEIDENSVEVFDEKTSIFNPFTVEDFTAFQADQKIVMEGKALDNGLLDNATEKAKESVYLLLTAVMPEGYTLTVE